MRRRVTWPWRIAIGSGVIIAVGYFRFLQHSFPYHASRRADAAKAVAASREPEAKAAEHNVLPAREVGVESGAKLQDGHQRADEVRAACGRLEPPCYDLEQGRLAGAVFTQQAVDLARDQIERDVIERLDAWVSLRELGDLEEWWGHDG